MKPPAAFKHPSQDERPALSWLAPLWGCVLGAAWQVTQPALWSLWAYQGLIGLGALLAALIAALSATRVLRRRSAQQGWRWTWGLWLLWLLAAACCMAGATGWRAHARWAQALPPALEGVDLQVQGRIASMLQNQGSGQRWRFEVEQWQPLDPLPGQAGELQASGLRWIDLSWYAGFAVQTEADTGAETRAEKRAEARAETRAEPQTEPAAAALIPAWADGVPLAPGQRWRFAVRLKRPHGARNPHGFDYELWAWEQGLQATGYVREAKDSPRPQRLDTGSGRGLEYARQWLRDRIRAQEPRLRAWWTGLAAAVPGLADHSARLDAALGVVAALAVGDQQAIEREDWTLFRQTGTAHLMSISGLHITMFAWLAALVVRRLWRLSSRACRCLPAPRAAALLGLVWATAYALLSGWGLPAQRTVCMLAVAVLLPWLGVRWPWPGVWLLALAAVVLVDPWALWQAGFWLSFVAVGVLLASSLRATSQGEKRTRGQFLSKIGTLWREQWLISLALAPLGLLLFGQVSVVGLLANLLAIPWVTLVVTPLALLAAVWPAAAAAAAVAMQPLMALLQWLASWPGAVWALPQPAWWASVLAIAAALAWVAPLPWRLRVVSAVLALPALFWPVPRPMWGEFELLAADIGQGNAVIVSTAGHRLLYDAGPRYGSSSDAGQRVLLPLLAALGMRLDAMMLSHRDMDHTGGALAVKAAQPALPVWGSDSVVADESLAALGQPQPVQRCTRGQSWQWEGVHFELLHPPAGNAWLKGKKEQPNFGSCVLRIRSASGRVALLAGDIEAAQEQLLLQSGLQAPVDWLLVPHHGSKTSSTPAWVQTLQPRWAVVQAGYLNRFGHPVAQVRERYAQAGSHLVLQSRCGAAHWSSAQPQQLHCQRQLQPRYWDANWAEVSGWQAHGAQMRLKAP